MTTANPDDSDVALLKMLNEMDLSDAAPENLGEDAQAELSTFLAGVLKEEEEKRKSLAMAVAFDPDSLGGDGTSTEDQMEVARLLASVQNKSKSGIDFSTLTFTDDGEPTDEAIAIIANTTGGGGADGDGDGDEDADALEAAAAENDDAAMVGVGVPGERESITHTASSSSPPGELLPQESTNGGDGDDVYDGGGNGADDDNPRSEHVTASISGRSTTKAGGAGSSEEAATTSTAAPNGVLDHPDAPRVVETDEPLTADDCVKQGWIYKLGGRKKTKWQKRWAELDVLPVSGKNPAASGSTLHLMYKASIMDKKLKGSIDMTGCAVSVDLTEKERCGKDYCIKLTPLSPKKKDKSYIVCVYDKADFTDWLACFNNAVQFNADAAAAAR